MRANPLVKRPDILAEIANLSITYQLKRSGKAAAGDPSQDTPAAASEPIVNKVNGQQSGG